MKTLFQLKFLRFPMMAFGFMMVIALGGYAQPGVERDVHTVKRGETLYRISRTYGMSVTELKEINGLSSNRIMPGQTLYVLPQEASSARSVTSSAVTARRRQVSPPSVSRVVDPEDYLYPTPRDQVTGDLSILDNNPRGFAPEVSTLGAPRGTSFSPAVPVDQLPSTLRVEKKKFHLVKPGEDLFSLSDEYGVSPQRIRAWNPDISGTGRLEPGQAVVVRKWYESVSRAEVDNGATPNTASRGMGNVNNSSTTYQYAAQNPRTTNWDSDWNRQGEWNQSDISSSFQTNTPNTYNQTQTRGTGSYVFIPPSNANDRISETGSYTSLSLTDYSGNRFYGVHKSLPEGSMVRIYLPNNAGYMNVQIVGKLSDRSRDIIGLSPACVNLLRGSGNPSTITLLHL